MAETWDKTLKNKNASNFTSTADNTDWAGLFKEAQKTDFDYDTTYNGIVDTGKEKLDSLYNERQASDETSISKYNTTMDTAAKQAVKGYEQSIEQAPLDALRQKNVNAVQEAINRKNVSETMANLGLTDSGLNRTQQTALTLQRGNADAAVDQQTQAYVNSLQTAIDDVMAEYEAQKANYANATRKATEDWRTGALADLQNTAHSTAASMYETASNNSRENAAMISDIIQNIEDNKTTLATESMDYDLGITEMLNEYNMNVNDNNTDLEIAGINAQAKANTASMDDILSLLKWNTSYATSLMEQGVPESIAWAGAASLNPTTGEEEKNTAATVYNTYNTMVKSGYSSNEAESIAGLVANGEDEIEAQTKIMEKALNGDLSDIVHVEDGANAAGILLASLLNSMAGVETEEEYGQRFVTMSKRWKADDWDGALDRMISVAETKIEKNYGGLSSAAKNYAIAKSIGQALKETVNITNYKTELRNTLCSKFGGEGTYLAGVACVWAGIDKDE